MDDQQQIKALQHDAQRFGELVRICPNGIAVCTGDRIACVNPALSRLVDRPADELAGTRFADLLFEAGRDRTCTRLAAMLAENAGHDTVCRTRLQRSDGVTIDVEASVDRLEASDGADSVIVFRPLAVFRNPDLLTAEEMVQRSHLLRMSVFGELAAALIHELGQPLTAARGASDLLESARSEDGTISFSGRPAEILMTAVGQVGDRFQKVWQFVRNRRPEISVVSINQTVQDAVELTSAAARHAGVELQQALGGETNASIDQSLVGLVTTGLIRRSITALQAAVGGQRVVRVTTSDCPGEFVSIEVEHNGAVLAGEELSVNAVPRDDADPDHLALSTYRLIIDENGGVLNIQPGLGGVGVRYQMLLPAGPAV